MSNCEDGEYLPMVFDWSKDYVSLLCDETCLGFSDKPGSSDRKPPHGELPDTQSEHLASGMKSKDSKLRELDLSRNSLKESAAELLSAGLESPHCRLETLRLSDCILSESFLASLVSALTRSHLMELDLSGNKLLMDSGVKLLCTGLQSPSCRLRILRLVCCVLTENSCASVRSALESNFSLEVLDLSGNSVQDSGVELLCAGLKSSRCMMDTLRLSCCSLSENSCGYLASALKSKPSRLKELDLSLNQLLDAGIKLLSDGLKSHDCKLKILRLICCGVSDEGCVTLVSALKSKPSDLTELDLSGNQLQKQGMYLLSDLVESSQCKLETLRVEYGKNLVSPSIRFRMGGIQSIWRKPTQQLVAQGPSHREEAALSIPPPWWSQEYDSSHLSLDPKMFNTVTDLSDDKSEAMVKAFSVPASVPTLSLGPVNIPVYDKGGSKTGRSFSSEPSLSHFLRSRSDSPPFKFELPRKQHGSQNSTIVAPSEVFYVTPDPNTANTKPDSSEAKTNVMKTIFTPDVLMDKPGETSYRFRVWYPGVYQCALTKLVFTMTGEGELLYRIIQWDENFLQAAGQMPAGPLYNIQCLEDAVSQLHFPHCDTIPATFSALSVVHISDDGLSILKPLEITKTHVVVDVPHLSAFGLVLEIIKRFLNIQKPISGQILLFHRPAVVSKSRKLNVFLLPENIPLPEVKGQQENAEYIEATSSCHLIHGQTYSLLCPEAYRVQPLYAPFDFKYGPNYHPTFEIRLNSTTEEATVTVRDQRERRVWEYHVELTGLRSASSFSLSASSTANEPAWLPIQTEGGSCSLSTANEPASLIVPAEGEGPDPQSLQREEERKLFSVRTEFIDRVSNSVLNDLLDELLQNRVINSREMDSVPTLPRADKARGLIDMVLKKGNPACKILIQTLCELDPFVSETLQLNQNKNKK